MPTLLQNACEQTQVRGIKIIRTYSIISTYKNVKYYYVCKILACIYNYTGTYVHCVRTYICAHVILHVRAHVCM